MGKSGENIKILSVSDVVKPVLFERSTTVPIADVDLIHPDERPSRKRV
jgi:hypothetical protein